MSKMDLFIIISTISLIFSIISLIIGLVALVKTIATEKSTHSVTYMPMDAEIDKENNEYLNWATKESKIAKDQELFQEDLETEMPDFFPDEEDRKVTSY